MYIYTFSVNVRNESEIYTWKFIINSSILETYTMGMDTEIKETDWDVKKMSNGFAQNNFWILFNF